MAVLPPYNSGITPIEIQIIQRQFASVRKLPRVSESFKKNLSASELSTSSWWSRTQEVDDYIEPTFRRLFTHQTWERYTGGTALGRLGRLIVNWRFCAVLSSTWPIIAISAAWSYMVRLPPPTSMLTLASAPSPQPQPPALALLLRRVLALTR